MNMNTYSSDMEFGISTFLEANPRVSSTTHAERIRQSIDEIVLAEQAGLDVYAIGEHHRIEYASSAPAVILAAGAAKTSKIRLSSAVTVLSSADPVRVYQDFATVDAISNGRAEIMAGRGSFIESFPLFGYDLDHYHELFEQKLDLLLRIRDSEKVSWEGKHRPAIHDLGVYPRSEQNPLPVWIGTGGSPESAVRAGVLGLPVCFAIIGGMPERFASLVKLYKDAGIREATEKVLVFKKTCTPSTTGSDFRPGRASFLLRFFLLFLHQLQNSLYIHRKDRHRALNLHAR